MALPTFACQAHGGKIISLDDQFVVKDLAVLNGTGGTAYAPYLLSGPIAPVTVGGYAKLRQCMVRVPHDGVVKVTVNPWRDGSDSGQMIERSLGPEDNSTVFAPQAISGSVFQEKITLSDFNAPAAIGSGEVLMIPRRAVRGTRIGPAVVASVTVVPATATLAVNGTQQLVAVVKDSRGVVLTGRVVTWASSNPGIASVDANGLVTAGAGPSSWPNAPALPTLSDQPWSAIAAEFGFDNSWGYHSQDGYADIVPDGSAPVSPSNVMRAVFPTTMPNDHQPASIYTAWGTNKARLYVGTIFKLSAGWDNHGCKLNMNWFGNYLMYTHLSDGDDSTRKIGIVVLWTPYSYDYWGGGDGGSWPSNIATTHIVAGQWYRYELFCDSVAGTIQWWVTHWNGSSWDTPVLQGSYTGVTFPGGGAGFIQAEYAYTRQIAPAVEQYIYTDHTLIVGA